MENWDFAGWGRARRITDIGKDPIHFTELGVPQTQVHKLDEWPATAICGNDITSSCLYVSALSIMAAGAYAPIALLMVALVLYLFRKIYAEVGSAIPLNGGTYTVLLNVTNKKLAAGAACLTLLSYVATAVISAGAASHYAKELWSPLNVSLATVGLLGVFAALNLAGIKESSRVALVIFIIHMVTLTFLVISGSIFVLNDPSILSENLKNPLPASRGSMSAALYFGFAAAMLGISGFESSANFIEEQKEGVFSKTLRNMWLAVSIFNPLICFLAICLIPLSEVAAHENSLLSVMGERSFGPILKTLIVFDAVLVLSGAVLTSYVGVIGLVRRMTLDRCLPQILLVENKWRETNHWIIISFFALCCGIYFIAESDVHTLAGVYILSFLSVMALYAIGNMLLKHKRSRLRRSVRASWGSVTLALFAVLAGLVGNLTQDNLTVFLPFFVAMSGLVLIMLFRVRILRLGFFILKSAVGSVQNINKKISNYIIDHINKVNSRSVLYFTKGDNIANLNRAALYVLENEQSSKLVIVHVYKRKTDTIPHLAAHLKTIDHLYPQLRIDFLAVKGAFGPDLIERLSRRLKVPKNYMFIGTPGDQFAHDLSSLGGVRLII
jgi:amino acid transporter